MLGWEVVEDAESMKQRQSHVERKLDWRLFVEHLGTEQFATKKALERRKLVEC